MTNFTLTRKPSADLTWTVPLKLVTPMIGGGAQARLVDSDQPVNGKTVRGHLRFWWRATRAGRYGPDGLSAMKRDEAWLFGQAATFDEQEKQRGIGPSRVQVSVNVVHASQVRDLRDGDAPKYAAFSLVENLTAQPPQTAAQLLEHFEFDLKLTVPGRLMQQGSLSTTEVRQDIEAALWAWVTFGGVGARTRRGFGALARRDKEQTSEEIRAGLQKHVLEGQAPKGTPQLSRSPSHTLIVRNNRPARANWEQMITLYGKYRQHRRPPKEKRPGRSYWPEPDEIRFLQNRFAPMHQDALTSVQKFPRAAFGLPIIFDFGKNGVRAGEPEKTTLRLVQSDRFASPLIMRVAPGGLMVATILNSRFPGDQLELHPNNKQDTNIYPVDHQLTREESNELLSKLPRQEQSLPRFGTDVLTTFLAYLKETLK